MSSRVPTAPLRILHCLRAPVGGLFRHVCDLVQAQSEAGHAVGVLCANEPNDLHTQNRLAELEKNCALGVTRIGLSRLPGLSDAKALRAMAATIRELSPNVVHGHGAKGGLLARCATNAGSIGRVYTPHGGSIHYAPNSPLGMLFGFAEQMMLNRTDGLIFESEFARSVFADRYGALPANTRVVHNGLGPHEFDTVSTNHDPADFLFLGEIRELKGVFTLLDAVAGIAAERQIKVDVVGDGPDLAAFRTAVEARSLAGTVNVLGPLPARDAFARAKSVVMPSHHDSFPYVALEAIAAGRPLIATSTGGIPEIFGPFADQLIEPANARALQLAMVHFLDHEEQHAWGAERLRLHVKEEFSLSKMADQVAHVYATALLGISDRLGQPSDASRQPKLDAAE